MLAWTPTPVDYLESRDPALHAFGVVAAMTGARRAQLLGLRWRNINVGAATVSFSVGWVEGPNGPVLTRTKTRHHPESEPGRAQPTQPCDSSGAPRSDHRARQAPSVS
jgi:hypothetical protein